MAKKEKQRFKIDFFEFSFLVEACIPERPIARAMFWQKVIDEYFYEMDTTERSRLYTWINRSYSMECALKEGNVDALEFNLRYNPDNQYLVHAKYKDATTLHLAYKNGDRYFVKRNTWIEPNYILSVEKAPIINEN